jgi:mannose-6-phosphate isomerase-like protein (cupin superfamily)
MKATRNHPPALCVTLYAVKNDPALRARGARKVLVTRLRPATERPLRQSRWRASAPPGRCPVLVTRDTECACFTERAEQTRHCHRRATEIYLVVEGQMTLEVEGTDYALHPGDMLVVLPGSYHEVQRRGRFLCRVMTLNCRGVADKYKA